MHGGPPGTVRQGPKGAAHTTRNGRAYKPPGIVSNGIDHRTAGVDRPGAAPQIRKAGAVIDLDATYTGKNGQRIRWEFRKSPKTMIRPANEQEYGIYFAYTELYFDQPMDLWIAVGSDDNSRLWIEDQLVWMSRRQLKPWRIDEGFRKVHFKKGINKVLCRVENGWGTMGWSMLINMDPSGAP